jgi:hypothetical protein
MNNDIRTPSNYRIRSKIKMKPFNFNIDPDRISKTLTRYIKAMIQILTWITIWLASVAAACVALSGIWVAVRYALKVIF